MYTSTQRGSSVIEQRFYIPHVVSLNLTLATDQRLVGAWHGLRRGVYKSCDQSPTGKVEVNL
jgi:hypothetical protein